MHETNEDGGLPVIPEPDAIPLVEAIRALAERAIADLENNDDRYDTDALRFWEVAAAKLYGDLGRAGAGRRGVLATLEESMPPALQLAQLLSLVHHDLKLDHGRR